MALFGLMLVRDKVAAEILNVTALETVVPFFAP